MKRTWSRMATIAAAVVTLFLVAAWPTAAVAEGYLAAQPFVDYPTEPIADYATDTKAAVHSDTRGFQRLPESPGGVYVKIADDIDRTAQVNEVLPGGAAGLSASGIRGPDLA